MKTVDRLMEERKWTVEDLAERCGISFARAEAIAVGRWTPSPADRQRITEAFEVELSDISWGHSMDPRNVRYRRFGFRES